MTAVALRTLSAIAADILADIDKRHLREALPYVMALTKRRYIETPDDYMVAAAVRRAIGPWRTRGAAAIKYELETILTLYRADHK